MAEGRQYNVVPLRTEERFRVVGAEPVPLRQQPDEELMLQHGAGSEPAFEELVRRYQGAILNYTFRMVRNRQIAEELTQEVFLALVRRAAYYQPTAKFRTYLYTIAANIVTKEWARQKRRPRMFSLSSWWSGNHRDESFDPMEHVADPDAGVEKQLCQEEVSAAVNEALRQLPEHQRQAFVLHRFQEMGYQEIAEITGAPVGTVKSRVVRAERALRPYLERMREYL